MWFCGLDMQKLLIASQLLFFLLKIYAEPLPRAEEKLAKIDEMRSATIFFFFSQGLVVMFDLIIRKLRSLTWKRAKFEAQMSEMENVYIARSFTLEISSYTLLQLVTAFVLVFQDSVASLARLKTASDKILTVDLPIILCMAITWTAMIAHQIRLLKSRPQTGNFSL